MKLNNKGLSLVELLVGVLLSAIIAIMVGTMLFYSVLNARNSRNAVTLQQDATFVTDMLTRAIRPSSSAGITISSGGQRIDIGTRAFYLSGNALMYDSNTGAGGTIVSLTSRVSSIVFTESTATVGIALTLSNGRDSIATNSSIAFRN